MRPSRRFLSLLTAGLLTTGLATAAVVPSGAGASVTPDPLADAISASFAPGSTWTPGPERYGHRMTKDVGVRMSDGTVLRANVDYPTDLATGAAAHGPFPVLLTMSPYGKDTTGSVGLGTEPYFVKRGYIDVVVDVRGTGASGGTFTLFDPKQTRDGVELVTWASRLPHSNGRVGMHGASYLGIDQVLTAGAVGKNSPLKAIFPVVTGNDLYRDTAFMGGIPDGSFDLSYLGGLLPVTNLVNPVVSALTTPANAIEHLRTSLDHAVDALNFNERFIATSFLGGPESYDTAWWHARRPADVLSKVVANGIPAYLIGGEYDIFQRGEPLNYAGLQNAWSGRPVGAPMQPGQRVTGRYQLLVGPWTHLQGGGVGSNFKTLELAWFDTWLKGQKTGMAATPTPLHYYDLGTGRYDQTTTYPITGAEPTVLYFDGGRTGSAPSRNDGRLVPTQPSKRGADSVTWAPLAGTVCSRAQDQWTMGAASLITGRIPTVVPCIDDDRPAQVGPSALTYTTAPMTHARTIAGPISATVFATANRPDTQWVVNISDVAPNGVSKPLTQGALLGSFRKLNAAKSWTIDGQVVMPYHDYSRASSAPVRPGALTEYRIEVFPTYATIAAGHRIRVTLSTSDFPHLLPTAPQAQRLAGGVYRVQHGSGAPSSVTIPLISR